MKIFPHTYSYTFDYFLKITSWKLPKLFDCLCKVGDWLHLLLLPISKADVLSRLEQMVPALSVVGGRTPK